MVRLASAQEMAHVYLHYNDLIAIEILYLVGILTILCIAYLVEQMLIKPLPKVNT